MRTVELCCIILLNLLQLVIMNQLTFSHCVFLVARELIGQPIESHYESLVVLTKQCNMKNVKVTKNTITATQRDYDTLLKHLVECIYQN